MSSPTSRRASSGGRSGIRPNSRASNGRHKLNQCLVRNSAGIVGQPLVQQIKSDPSLHGETRVETVYQDICVNEEGHGRTGPLLSNPGYQVFPWGASCGKPHHAYSGGRSLGQTTLASARSLKIALWRI